jgi:hypothetical protein
VSTVHKSGEILILIYMWGPITEGLGSLFIFDIVIICGPDYFITRVKLSVKMIKSSRSKFKFCNDLYILNKMFRILKLALGFL